MTTTQHKEIARKVFEEVLKPAFKDVIKQDEMLQVIFAYDMKPFIWCTDYGLKVKLEMELKRYCLNDRNVAREIMKLFAEDEAMDEVKLFHNPGKDTGDLMNNIEEFYMFLVFNAD